MARYNPKYSGRFIHIKSYLWFKKVHFKYIIGYLTIIITLVWDTPWFIKEAFVFLFKEIPNDSFKSDSFAR